MTSKDGSREAPRRVLDEAGRKRRARKALEALEQDNYHDDPHANLVMSKKAPRFQEALTGKDRRRKTRGGEVQRQRFRRNFTALLEEEEGIDGPGYITATAPQSSLPPRHLCGVCGFPSPYTCVVCGARYCTTRCLATHTDTRCLKYTS